MALAVIGPIPGMVASRRLVSSCRCLENPTLQSADLCAKVFELIRQPSKRARARLGRS